MDDDICPICYDNNVDYIAEKCNHKFCKKCIDSWLRKNHTCPMCRACLKDTFYLYNFFYIPRIVKVYDFHLCIIDKFNNKTYITGNNLKSVYIDYKKKCLVISGRVNQKLINIKLYGKMDCINACFSSITNLISSFTYRYTIPNN